MYYKNSQGNIINLDNVREIVKRPDVVVRERNPERTYKVSEAIYDVQVVGSDPEEYSKTLERLDSPDNLGRFMSWLWFRMEEGTEYCSFEEFRSVMK